jgi:hypothetical protein
MTLQPVPQKRHGALSHFSSETVRSVTRFAASAGTGMPPAAAAMAAASSLSTWRRSSCLLGIGKLLRPRRLHERPAPPKAHAARVRLP